MQKAVTTTIFFVLLFAITAGCSGVSEYPVLPQDEKLNTPETQTPVGELPQEREVDSTRVLWGLWNITFDSGEMKLDVEPIRNLQAHFNITNMIVPPACDDCFSIAVKGFDPVTRILDADVSLRNPTPIGGKDVRGILHTNDYGHLITNPDDWTAFWDVPGGDTINPFIAYNKTEPTRTFPGNAELTENFLVYIPIPPSYFAITFAVDASWPGNCKEPYSIENFSMEGPLYPLDGSSCNIIVDVYDWQDDVDTVQISVPEITGTDYVDMSFDTGNTWNLLLSNNEVAPVGDYDAMIIAASANSADTKLYDFVTVSITDTDSPLVTSVEPDSGMPGESLVDVSISGSDFMGPCEVEFRLDSYVITTTNVEVIDANHVECDFTIPLDADLGIYDISVENFDTKTGVGADLFEVFCPEPEIISIEPNSGDCDESYTDVQITGANFIGPTAEVKLMKTLAGDIYGSNVVIVDESTITCDFHIPANQDTGLYDVQITNGCEAVGTGNELYEVICPAPIVDSIDPDMGELNEDLVGVAISGQNFIFPNLEVKLTNGSLDILGTNLAMTDKTLFHCDFHVPDDADYGMYDVIVTNGCGESGTGEDLFEVLAPPVGWAQTWGGLDEDEGFDVAIDEVGNSYVTGFFRNTVDFDPDPVGVVERTSVGSEDAFLCKYKPQGTLEWALTWGSTSGDRGYGVAVDDNGAVLVTGHFQGTTDFDPGDDTENRTPVGYSDAYLSAFSLDGEFYGVNTWGGTLSDGGYGVVAYGPDAYVTGTFSGTVDFDWDPVDVASRTSLGSTDIFILKVVGEGDFGWVQTWGGTGNDEGESVAVDSSGDVYISGNAKGYSIDFDPDPVDTDYKDATGANSWAFISKLDSYGDYQWSGRWGNNSDTNGADIAIDGSDNIYVTGHFMWYNTDLDPDPVGEDIHINATKAVCYLNKFDPTGDYIWGLHWGGGDEDKAIGVAANSSGDIFVSGYFIGDADLDPDSVDVDTHTGFGRNAFLSKFTSAGDYVWGKSWANLNSGYGRGVAANDDGESWSTGLFDGSSVDFNPDPVGEDLHTSNGDQDPFLIKFLSDGTW